MSIRKLVRYYHQDNIELVMLKKHRYICINNYEESYRNFYNQPKIQTVVKNLAKSENLLEEYVNNRSNGHLKTPNAVILSYRGYTFIHPYIANLFFSSEYPSLSVHLFRFYEQKTYLHSDSPRNDLYLPIEEGHQQWVKTFIDELYEQFYRLYDIENNGKSYQHPLFFAQLTNKYIYDQLPVFGSEEVKKELKQLRETDDTRTFVVKLHQYLDDKGRDLLIGTIYRIIAYIDSACSQFHEVAHRKMWLENMLNDKKTGQTRLALNTYTQKIGA